MGNPQFVPASGVVYEVVGDDLLVYRSEDRFVLKVNGLDRDLKEKLLSGAPVDVSSNPNLEALAREGILVTDRSGLSRRGVLRAGVVGAGAGIAALSFPTIAAASSVTNLAGLWAPYLSGSVSLLKFQLIQDLASGWPSTVPSTNQATIGDLTVGTGEYPVTSSSFPEFDSGGTIVWESDIEYGNNDDETYIGTFIWAGSPFRVTFSFGGVG